MRILHIDTGKTWRGGQAQALLTARFLARQGHECHLLVQPGSPLEHRAKSQGQLTVHTRPMRFEADPLAAAGIARLYRRHHFDILHAHNSHAHGLAWLASLMCPGMRLVVTRRLELAAARHWLGRKKYLRADALIAISASVRQSLLAAGVPDERIHIVPDGVDARAIEGEQPASDLVGELLPKTSGPTIGCIGALTAQKDHATFIRAAAIVHQHRPDARFVIVGEGELRADLEKLIDELNLSGIVALAGFQRQPVGWIKAMDLFVLTSVFEGLCSTLIEAMLADTPIIATNVGGVPDLISPGSTGKLVPPSNPQAVADAILTHLSNPAPGQTMAENARRSAQPYDYSQLTPRIESVYERALSRK